MSNPFPEPATRSAVRSFLNRVGYTISDTLPEADDIRASISAWEEAGVSIPEGMTWLSIYQIVMDAIDERHPASFDALIPEIDRKVYEYLDGIKVNVDALTEEAVSFTDVVCILDAWQDPDAPIPAYISPDALMRWINSHHEERTIHDRIWIKDDGDLIGPFRTLTPDVFTPTEPGLIQYVARDSVRPDPYVIRVDRRASFVTSEPDDDHIPSVVPVIVRE